MTRTPTRESSGTRKAAALLLAVLFQGALGAEAFAVRGCPHHHPRPSPASQTGADAAPTARAGLVPLAPEDGAPPPHCSCVGDCGAAAAAVLPGTPPVSVVPSPAAREHASPPVLGTVAGRRAPYLLPFPNGPPLA